MNTDNPARNLERVFVIDDEERISSLCGKILSKSGYEVIAPPYGPDALDLARKGDFDLLLMDFNMPDTTGVNLFRELRAAGHHQVTGVLMTAHATAEMLSDALDAGVSAFVSKPFTADELRRGVEAAFAKVRLQKENARLKSIVALLELRMQLAGMSHMDEVHDLVTDVTEKKMMADRVAMLLRADDPKLMSVASVRGIGNLSRGTLTDTSGTVSGYVLENGHSVLISQQNVPPDLVPRLRYNGLVSGVCVPLRTERGVVGVLSASRARPGQEYSESDLRFLESFAGRIASEMEARSPCVDGLRNSCLEAVSSIMEEIEASDRWFKGHAARVAACSERIARALGMAENEIDLVRVAAIIHDMGRLGVPEHQLVKKEVWDGADLFRMKGHVQHGEKILKASVLPDSVLKAVRHHHEWYGGEGYPDGLKAEAIPLAARIIRVADTAVALSSERSHRAMFSAGEFREELIRGRGKQFDPRILDVALRLHDETRLLEPEHPYYRH